MFCARNIKRMSVLTIALAIAGCDDVIRTDYETLEDAKEAGAMSGWLPPVLPNGATNIVEINDLDLNRGYGSFRFPKESMAPYLETLSADYGATITQSSSEISVALQRWDIILDPNKGSGTYTIK